MLSARSSSARHLSRSILNARKISTTKSRPPIAIAFDIDGVLKQGSKVLPEALQTLNMLDGDNEWHTKVPYLFITNSGGKMESERARDLSKDFQRKVIKDQVIQAHTVMQSLARMYADKPILMIGGPNLPPGGCRSVLESYGFNQVYTAFDLHAYAPASYPYAAPDPEQQKAVRQVNFSKVQFEAIFVFHDSREWGRDIQYCVDVMRSDGGVFGTVLSNKELRNRKIPPIYFSHGDLLWGNDFSVPRLGQGAFRFALESVWKQVTDGAELNATTFGKPEQLTYEYANELLHELLRHTTENKNLSVAPENVWMIGDNPASDVMGANGFGWSSALVRTGVWTDDQGAPAHKPTLIANNVKQAVEQIMKRTWN
ncbi:hypothetical protein MYAM1_001950 [Malassezia yamatoensis]|uniref:Uncharacterized protein n=1 Tax=Malassezia yamatoensis TaxID=253288 RepID=A0AAJ6CIS8_9BASI|nr:hypothetical protein MYAM1_001950 [Malassezia yamatoensis]